MRKDLVDRWTVQVSFVDNRVTISFAIFVKEIKNDVLAIVHIVQNGRVIGVEGMVHDPTNV